MALTSAMEDYLEAVFMLQKQNGYVRCVDVAKQLRVKKPSVSRQSRNYPDPTILLKMLMAHSPSQKQDCSLPNRFTKSIVFLQNGL